MKALILMVLLTGCGVGLERGGDVTPFETPADCLTVVSDVPINGWYALLNVDAAKTLLRSFGVLSEAAFCTGFEGSRVDLSEVGEDMAGLIKAAASRASLSERWRDADARYQDVLLDPREPATPAQITAYQRQQN